MAARKMFFLLLFLCCLSFVSAFRLPDLSVNPGRLKKAVRLEVVDLKNDGKYRRTCIFPAELPGISLAIELEFDAYTDKMLISGRINGLTHYRYGLSGITANRRNIPLNMYRKWNP